jgi:CDP-diacylglycerol pyrophosphatase
MANQRVNQPERVPRSALHAALSVFVAMAVLLAFALPAKPAAGPPLRRDALWHLVHDLCLGDLRLTGSPLPCASVDAAGGYAVVRVGAGHLLLVPTVPVRGIEDPLLLGPEAARYWDDAWQARDLLRDGRGQPIPADNVGLAVNSAQARTQDQLHIHVACLSPKARHALAAVTVAGPGWTRHAVHVDGSWYDVLRVAGSDLASIDPFRLLAERLGISAANMPDQTLVVAAASERDGSAGFYVLNRAGSVTDPATGERLLDPTCGRK